MYCTEVYFQKYVVKTRSGLLFLFFFSEHLGAITSWLYHVLTSLVPLARWLIVEFNKFEDKLKIFSVGVCQDGWVKFNHCAKVIGGGEIILSEFFVFLNYFLHTLNFQAHTLAGERVGGQVYHAFWAYRASNWKQGWIICENDIPERLCELKH